MRSARRQARGPGLPLILAALAACARVEPPPGGPPDPDPPTIIAVSPDSGAVVPNLDGELEIRFDEVIEEAATAGRGRLTGLARFVLLSPVEGETQVRWRRNRITVEPRSGWRPNVVYRLEILPGIRDLRSNVTTEGRLVIFSTGPAIPTTALGGHAVDWTKSAPLRAGIVEARPAGDSIGYRTIADSVGGFRLNGVPPGAYVVYAFEDQNQNRVLDRREALDSVAITLDTAATVELWTLVRDTVPPRLTVMQVADSVAARVEASLPLDPYQTLSPGMARVRLLPDSIPLEVTAVWHEAAYDSVSRARAAEGAARDTLAADSAAAEPDTAGVGRDTARVVRDTAQVVRDTAGRIAQAPRPAQPRPGGQAGQARERAPDTTAVGRLLASRPKLSQRVIVEVVSPWLPGSNYFVELFGLRSAAGVVADTTGAVLATPERPAAPDTTPNREPPSRR